MLFKILLSFGLTAVAIDAAPMCLSASKFTASVMQVVATLQQGATTPKIYDIEGTMDFDADRKMIGIKGITFDADADTHTNTTTIQDFSNDKMYISGTGFCVEQSLNGATFFGLCIPASLMETSTYTTTGGGTVHVFSGGFNGMLYHVHISDNGRPVAINSFGHLANGQFQTSSTIFGNVQMGILSDPHVFQNVGCHGSGGVVGK